MEARKRRPPPKVFGGAKMVRVELENEESGERGGGVGVKVGWRGAESSIIEENLTAAERTIASFYPGRVNDFVVDLIALRFSQRNETLSAVKMDMIVFP